MSRLPITKTPKVYVGGAFIRSESARTFPLKDAAGNFFANIPQCTRKDLRNAVEAAAKAGPGWAKRTAYNRGQIITGSARCSRRAPGETWPMPSGRRRLEGRRGEGNHGDVDRLIYYAGWADKYEQVLGNVNPVAAPYFNFTVTEPMGIVGRDRARRGAVARAAFAVAPAITSGNTVVALASSTQPYPAIVLGEMLATSDLPGGVVNLLTGFRKEMVPTFATHTHLRAIAGVANAEERKALKLGAADSVKRTQLLKAEEPIDWFADTAQSLYEIRDHLEFKTTWHPIGA
jgi:acyl-CoA reductase-like NAD-dependent aldehyde dehydrogenase